MDYLEQIREFLDTFEDAPFVDEEIIKIELTGWLKMSDNDRARYLHHREQIKAGGFTMSNISDEEIIFIDALVDKYREDVPAEEHIGCIFYFSVQ